MQNLMNYTNSAWAQALAPFVLRVATGLIFLVHGWQKLQNGIPQTAGFLGMLGFPAPEVFAALLIAAEVGGGVLLILGLFTRYTAKVLAVVALIAFLTVHMTKGFFVNAGGYEFIVLILAASISLMITGAGAWSLDKVMKK